MVAVLVSRSTCVAVMLAVLAGGCTDQRDIIDDAACTSSGLDGASTVVSLTFDDTRADQYVVRPMLAAHGMHATFYVNSPRFGVSDNELSIEQARELAADGNEIGGHTLNHANLANWPTEVVRREVCNDRAALIELGFSPRSLAYPFGSPNQALPVATEVQQAVHECGYNSARSNGGLRIGSQCPSCPVAESIPPANAYYIRAGQSVNVDTTLDVLQDRVIQAENQGGGWLPIVFHHVCDRCNFYSISPDLFADFLSWLAPRSAQGTVVRTVGDVIGGEVRPPVVVPPPPPPMPGANLILNPSLELDVDGDRVPDCWQAGGSGTNTATFDMTTDAYDGEASEVISIASLTSGARRLVTRQDYGLCAPMAYPGHSYAVSAFYRSTVPARFIAYYSNDAGEWSLFAQSGWLAPQTGFTQARWTIPALPADARQLSVGMSIFSVGQLTLDAFELRDLDTTAPTLQVVAPITGARKAGNVVLAAEATDAGGVYSLQFLVNGRVLSGEAHRRGALYALTWDTTQVPNGDVTVTARALDYAGNATTTTTRFAVDNTASCSVEAPTPWLSCDGKPCNSNWSAKPISLELGGLVDCNADVCAIQYSLTGLDPIEHGIFYDGPVTISSAADVRAVAVSCTGAVSRLLSQTLLVDVTPPTNVGVSTPANGATIVGTTPISVEPSDNIALVRFYFDGVQLGTRNAAPWRWNFNASSAASGNHAIHVVVEDRAGNKTASDAVQVTTVP